MDYRKITNYRKEKLYYKTRIWYDTSGDSNYRADLYDNPDYQGEPVGVLTSSHNAVHEADNNHPDDLHHLYMSNKVIEIYNNFSLTKSFKTDRRLMGISYVAHQLGPVDAQITYKKGFPNVEKVRRVIRNVEPPSVETPMCHSTLVFFLRA
jgi:hypothetical protein